ncbi:pre-rRNA-processing protein esf1 [Lecanora helva]
MAKPQRQKTPNRPGVYANHHISDPRFANIQTDPRFRLPSKKNTHVQIDQRFAHMLRDDDFSSRAKVDRYGRKLPKSAGRQELKKYYKIEEEDEQSSEDVEDEEEEDKIERLSERIKGSDARLSSSEDSSSSDEEVDEEEGDEVFGLLNEHEGENAVPKGEVSSRVAVVNLDWDNIRATDLMVVFSSFIPTSGRIRKISIYPSDFGKERMEREEMDGPPREIFGSRKQTDSRDAWHGSGVEDNGEDENEGDESDDEKIKKSMLREDQGEEFNSGKLRRYQLERLRYYYAVLDCSSMSVAQAIYDAVDGTEYLSTANFFDLRYVPDDVDFSQDEPRDECETVPSGYRPNEFVTDALQHSKVRLTWDADDVSRKEVQKRAFGGSRAEIDENEFKAYLGSDTSEDEDPEPIVVDATAETPTASAQTIQKPGFLASHSSRKEMERQRMRALLGLDPEPTTKKRLEDNQPTGDMQVTFSAGLSSDSKKGPVFENEPERNETTAEKYTRKEKERKARRKEKMKASRNATESANEPSNRDLEQNGQPEKEGDSPQDLGFSDPFFTIPSRDPSTKSARSKAEKRRNREERAAEEMATAAERAELELLMVDDKAATKDLNHFDINDIAKAEKALSRKKKLKKHKMREKEAQALEVKQRDQFQMDVGDERFRDVFERNEFAIDPSHPRYKGTEGMKRLLEEGRRKRKDGSGKKDGADDADEGGKKVKRKMDSNGTWRNWLIG